MSVDFDLRVSFEDHQYGAITVTVESQTSVLVEGDKVPEVWIERTPGTEINEFAPVGTRRAEDLTMTVAGEPVALLPAIGRLSRRSYRIDVDYGGSRHRLQPNSIAGSRLTRDGKRLGEFFRQDGDLVAEWETLDDIRASDVALGYALAAAFGTGAQPAWMTALDVVGAITPG